MLYNPYDYQEKAINFITEHKNAVLFLDMGLGKSSISLTAFTQLKAQGDAKKLLIVAPKRVAEITWPDEIEKWDHTCTLSYSLIVGTPKQREKAVKEDADVYIIGRDSISWLAETNLCPKCDMLIVDELQSFKTHNSARTEALVKIRENFNRVVGLSGTPAPNGWLDLWAQYLVIDKGAALGTSYWAFRNKHFVPNVKITVRGKERVLSYRIKSGHEEEIEKAVHPLTLSMKAIDNLPLPGITYQSVYAVMDEKETMQYNEFASNFEGYVGNEKLKVPTDEALVGKLVQLANGIAYNSDGNAVVFHDHKLEALSDLIESANGQPLLVAYWFKSDRDRISRYLKEKNVSFADIDSTESVEKWNSGRLQVALIHPQKAGHGLNLQKGGATLVWYTLPWNLEFYEQTNARLYRNGQTKHVNIVHIITKNTIDGAIYGTLKRKKKNQDKLFEATKTLSEDNHVETYVPDPLDAFVDNLSLEDIFSTFCEYIYVEATDKTILPPPIKFQNITWQSDSWAS